MPTEKEIEAAAKSIGYDCCDLEQSSEMYKRLGVNWKKIAKAALEAAERVRKEEQDKRTEEIKAMYLQVAIDREES